MGPTALPQHLLLLPSPEQHRSLSPPQLGMSHMVMGGQPGRQTEKAVTGSDFSEEDSLGPTPWEADGPGPWDLTQSLLLACLAFTINKDNCLTGWERDLHKSPNPGQPWLQSAHDLLQGDKTKLQRVRELALPETRESHLLL